MNKLAKISVLRRIATVLLVATLAVRALVPVGYMPGNILAGQLAELCPVASAATFTLLGSETSHEHHHGAEEADAYSIGVACPIGSSLFFDALPTILAPIELARQQHILSSTPIVRSYLAGVNPTYGARAPPSS